ncbi:MAG: VOC family protein, partial [Terracidiphilus sp.]
MLMLPIRNLRFFLLPVFAVALAPALFHAQDAAPPRPQITGVSHVGYFVSDLPKTLAFWHDLLGFD